MNDPILEALGAFDDSDDFFGITDDYGSGDDEDNQDGYPESLQEKKLKSETKKIDISNEKELYNLVEKKMVHSLLAAIGQSIQTNFINMGRIVSPELAARMGIPQKEREINQFLDDKIGTALENVQKKIEQMNDDGIFER